MSDSNLTRERFLATARQHFFASDPDGACDRRDNGDECSGASCREMPPRAHSGN